GGAGCTPISTGILAPGSVYTVSNLCGCAQQYTVIFTNDTISMDSIYLQDAVPMADPPAAKITSFILKKPSCNGFCDGKVIAVLNTFGALPITVTWTSSNPGTVTSHTINSHTK